MQLYPPVPTAAFGTGESGLSDEERKPDGGIDGGEPDRTEDWTPACRWWKIRPPDLSSLHRHQSSDMSAGSARSCWAAISALVSGLRR
jgi:hypothetical protein